MKVLFIGGTGNISTAVSHAALARGIELWHVNRGRTRQFIFISTASAYHKLPTQPLITEATPLHNPFWDYSQRKIACEAHLLADYRATGFPVTIVRPSHTYAMALPVALGGSSDYAVIERMLRGQEVVVHGDGTSLWTVTHSGDFARGFVGLLGNPQAIGEAFHITADTPLTWNEIYATLGAAAGVTPRIVHVPTDFIIAVEPALRGPLLGDKAHSTMFDNSKIRRLVPAFVARVPLHEGARRALQWFNADPRANEHVWLTLGFAGVTTGTIEGSQMSPVPDYYRGIVGSTGGLCTGDWGRQLTWFRGPKKAENITPLTPFDKHAHFLDVVEGRAPSLADVQAGRTIVCVSERAVESALTGAVVRL